MKTRPNILFLLNDHQAFYGHGEMAGGPVIQRPHFDKLGAEGVNFSRAYTASPLCGPARRTMLTGLFPHNHQEIRNDTEHPFDREVYLDELAGNGYSNYYYGKWHAGPGTALDHDCEGFSYPSYNNPYTKPEYKEYLAREGLAEPGIHLKHVFQGWRREDFASCLGGGEPYIQDKGWCNEHACGIMTGPKETHEAFFLAHLACRKLEELAASDSPEPFHLRVDFWGPHAPYFVTQEYADMYNPSDIPEYPSFSDDLSSKPERYKSENNYPLHKDYRIIHPNPLPWSTWQETMALAYAQQTLIDDAGGLILKKLEELGLAENTLVVWTTDHGDGLACHGGHFDKDAYMAEEMIRIPMAVRWPGRIPAGQTSDKLVSLVDLVPTFLDAAGTVFEEEPDGRSLVPLCVDATSEWRSDLMCESHGHCTKEQSRILLTDRHKYVFNDKDTHELYDLIADPYELNNLIDASASVDILADMKLRLKTWQDATKDYLVTA